MADREKTQGTFKAYASREGARHFGSLTRTSVEEAEVCKKIARRIREEMQSHPKQLAFFDDPSPQVAALCTRQAGKTFGCVHRQIYTALTKPNSYSVYINTSRDECRNIVWENPDNVGLLSTLERFNIPCDVNDTRMSIRIPAMRSRIKLIGIDDSREVNKLRGPTYDDVIIDESQSIPYLRRMAIDVAGPGTIKRKGALRLIGTPGDVCEGFFHDITREDGGALPGWSVHRFTIYDNPGIPHAREYVDKIKLANGWADDDETYLREYCGRWAAASRILVYRLSTLPRERRYHAGLPLGHDWRYLIGVDLGYYPDPFGVVVWAYCDDIPCLFEAESEQYESLDTEQQAKILAGLVEKYNPDRVVCDAGSGGLKQIVVGDWQQRYGLPVDVAQKEHKDSAIDAFNADLVGGRVRLREGSPLDKQMLVLPWKDKIGSRRVEDVHRNSGRFHNHLCDAALYGYRESSFFDARPRPSRPAAGTPELYDLRAAEEKDKELELYRAPEVDNLYDLMEDDGDWKSWNR